MSVFEAEDLGGALLVLRELWALDHALGSASKRMHRRLGITAEQRMLLRFVGERPGITSVELAMLLHVEKSTLSATLRLLEHKQLVARRRDASDRRRAPLALTARGRKLIRRPQGTVEQAVAETLSALGPRDVAAVRRFLRGVVESLRGQ